MSFASATVGVALATIDSRRFVATYTRRFQRLQRRTMAFCQYGTRSIGISRDKSPRSTRTLSAAEMISSIWRRPDASSGGDLRGRDAVADVRNGDSSAVEVDREEAAGLQLRDRRRGPECEA